MTDEEKKAIGQCRLLLNGDITLHIIDDDGGTAYCGIVNKEYNKDLETVLNLIEKQSKEIEELKEDKYGLEEEVQIQAKNLMLYENALSEIQDKIKAKIEEKFLETKGLYERGVQPRAQYTMKLLRDLEKSLLEKE